MSGKFIFSINDVEEIRRTFSDFNQIEVETTYSVAREQAAAGAAELVITNFDPSESFSLAP